MKISKLLFFAVFSWLGLASVSGQDWIAASLGSSASGALQAGNEADGTPVYVVRAPFGGGMVPGKFIPKAKAAYVPWGGKENRIDKFELFVGKGRWVAFQAGNPLPPNAVPGGNEADGSRLFIIRAPQGKALVPGKYSEVYGKGYIPWGGKELEVQRFELLVADEPPAKVEGTWIPADGTNNASAAVAAGISPDGTPSFLIRAPFQGGLVPGKYNPKAKRAYVPWGGKENEVKSFELYTGRGSWVPADPKGPPPPNAVSAGYEADSTPLLAIRSPIDKALVPGKYNVKTREASVSLGGKEVRVTAFEFLVEGSAPPPPTPPPSMDPPPAQPLVVSEADQVWKFLSFTSLMKPAEMVVKGGSLSVNGELAASDPTLNKKLIDSYRLRLDQNAEFSLVLSWAGKRSDFKVFLFDEGGDSIEPVAVDDQRVYFQGNKKDTGDVTLAVLQAGDKLPGRYGFTLDELTYMVEGDLQGDLNSQESIVSLALDANIPFWHLEVGGDFLPLFDVRDASGKVLARSVVLDDTDNVSGVDFTPPSRGAGDVRIYTKLPTQATHWKLYVTKNAGQ